MLHVNTYPKQYVFALTGSVEDIATDIIWIIAKTYMCFRKRNPVVAEFFKHSMIAALTDPKCPPWEMEQGAGEVVIAASVPKEGE